MENKSRIRVNPNTTNKDKASEKQKVPAFPPGDPYAPAADVEDPRKVVPKTVTAQLNRHK